MGGQIVMELCRLYPLRVQGIVLAATFPQSETSTGKQQRLAAADRLQQQGMAAYAADVLPKILGARSIVIAPDIVGHVFSFLVSAPPPPRERQRRFAAALSAPTAPRSSLPATKTPSPPDTRPSACTRW